MEYKDYKWFFPPRPENNIPSKDLNKWDNKRMLYQPKFNGSNCTVYTNGEKVYKMNRRGSSLTRFKISDEELIKTLYKKESGGEWLVLNGEYLNKNKDYSGEFNHKFIIFDILVENGKHLSDKSFKERQDILRSNYLPTSGDNLMDGLSENIFLTKTFSGDLEKNFNSWIDIDLIEGVVIKDSKSKLEYGLKMKNNTRWQIKCRKPTRNYRY